MSYGFIGRAWLEAEDDETAIYSYSGEDINLHEADSVEKMKVAGSFIIRKSCLQEPEIHRRVRKMPNGRKKLVEKKIVISPNIGEAVNNGGIEIEKLCGIDELKSESIPKYAFALLWRIFDDYQRNGKLPKKVSIVK